MRYQVRVGIDRSVFIAEVSEVAVLPEGWTYSLDTIIDDGRTINVGDVSVKGFDTRGYGGEKYFVTGF